MDYKTFRLLQMAQLCFYVGIIACILLKPAGLAANDGISYYGHFRYTFIPYSFALLGSAYFCGQSAKRIKLKTLKPLSRALWGIALLEVLICLSPVTAAPWLRHVHTTSGSILFSLQLLLSIWLVIKHRTRWAAFFVLLELTGGVGSAVWLLPSRGFLIQAQLVFQVGFSGALLYSATHFMTYNVLSDIEKRHITQNPKIA